MVNFVGRERELGWLRGRLESAAAGRPQTVVVEGPAGIGKSALITAFASHLDPAQLVTGSGDEDERSLSYGLLEQLTGARGDAWDDPFAAGAEVLRLLDNRSDGAPTVFVVDDAHLADTPSLRALTFALRRLRADRVLFLVAAPEDDVGRLPAGLLRLATAEENRLRLAGLTDTEVAELVRGHGHDVPSRVATRLRHHTDGNPLHLNTLLVEAPDATLTDDEAALPAPTSFARTVLGQLSVLTPPAQELAHAAAVLSDDSRLSVVAAVAGLTGGAADAAAEELDSSGLVRCRRIQDDWTLRFAHPLVRAAVNDDLGPVTRARLHVRASEQLTGDDALVHRVAAATGPDEDLSNLLAGRAREMRGTGLTHRAAELMLSAAHTAPPGHLTDERLLEALNLFLMDGDVAAAKGLEGSLDDLPPTAQRLYLRSKAAWLAGRPSDAEHLALEAWARGAELESDRRGGLAAVLAQLCNLRGDGEEAAVWSQRALSLDLPPDLVDSTEAARLVGLTIAGHVHDAVDSLAGLVSEESSVRSHSHRLTARGALRLATDDIAGARDDLTLVCESGGRVWPQRLVAMGVLAELEFRVGRWDASLALADQAVSLAEDSEQDWVLGFLHSTAVLTTAARGAWEDAQHHLDAGEQLVTQLGDPATLAVCANAAVHLASCRGDSTTVVTVAEQLRALGGRPAQEPGFLGWPGQYVGALVDLGRLEEAASVLEEFEAIARERGSRSRLAVLARLRGEIATAQRSHSAARDAFEESVRMGEGAASALDRALTHAAYGRFLRRRGERRAAVARLEQAHGELLALSAVPFLRRCEAELAACGIEPTGHEPPTADRASALTPQERMVAGLACRGLTNAEIAREMVLSAKTVAYHLGNVYTKLDVHSRAQLVAAWPDRS
jgi:ATP/maltotriose-dependent transcriptional regulator MalT